MPAYRACLAIAAMFSFSSAGQSAPAPSAGQANPNEVVCEKVQRIGSRVAFKKICATRAEWDEKRRLDRETTDQAQRAANVGCQTANTHTGAASC